MNCNRNESTSHGASRLLGTARSALCAVLCALVAAAIPGSAHAEWVSTPSALAGPAAQARVELGTWLEREDVRTQLEQLGIEPEEAHARVASLSDAEVVELQGRVAELPAGGSTLVEIVGGGAIIILGVLAVTDLLGLTDVFPFIRPLSRSTGSSSS